MFHYDYFNESLLFGKDQIGSMAIQRRPMPAQADADRQAHRQRCSRTRPYETKTATERAFIKQLLEQIGNIGMILISVTCAVFFTMLLVTANTMAQSVRERTNEIGVLKTLGFSAGLDPRAGAARIAVADAQRGARRLRRSPLCVARCLAPFMKDYFPVFEHCGSTIIYLRRYSLMVAFGLITGLWPALTRDAAQDRRRAAAQVEDPPWLTCFSTNRRRHRR